MYFQNISVNPIISKILFFVTSHFGTLLLQENRLLDRLRLVKKIRKMIAKVDEFCILLHVVSL